jgi:hypothetical protein
MTDNRSSAATEYVLMPREATRAMTMAACDCLPSCEHVFGYAGELLRKSYAKMVDVAGMPTEDYWKHRAERAEALVEELKAADRDHLAAKNGMEKRLTAEIERLRDAAQGTWPSVEAIAACIDPVAFDPISLDDKHPGWECRRERAIETAKKIADLAAQPPAAPVETKQVLATAVRQEEPATHSGLLAQGVEGPHSSAGAAEPSSRCPCIDPYESCEYPSCAEGRGKEDPLADLVAGFSAAMLEKLRAAEKKYGWGDGWRRNDWQESCQRQLQEHLAKGDPRDVANYCAFMWHHGWSTTPDHTINEPQTVKVTDDMVNAAAREIWNDSSARMGGSWSLQDPKEVVVVQTLATARAALNAALAVTRPNQQTQEG